MFPFLFIVIYLVLVLIRPQDYAQWPAGGPPLLPIALAAALLSWTLSREKRFDAPQYPLLVAFMLLSCFSLVVFGWMGGAVAQFNAFLPTVASFFVLANTATPRRRVIMVMRVMALCACILAIHGVDLANTGVGWTGASLVEDSRIQYVGIFSDPNDLAMLFLIAMPMAIYLASVGGLLGLRRVFWLAGGLLLFYGIYLTNSRGALLAVAVMAGIYLWVRRGWLVAAALGTASLLALMMMPSRLNELDVQESSAQDRVEAWYEGMQMFLGNPLFGVGTDRFTEYHHLTAHSSIILVLAENGILGFMAWFALLGYSIWMMARILRHEPELADEDAIEDWHADWTIALTLLVAMAGAFTAALFLSRSYVILLYLLVALVVAHFSGVRDRFPSVPALLMRDHVVRWPVLAALVVIGMYVVVRVLLVLS